jgi:two-component system sensor histidine kinase KdpD
MVWADRQLLEMALFQLLDNAAKYGSPDSSITIDVQDEQAETVISIRNEGSYIPLHREKKYSSVSIAVPAQIAARQGLVSVYP